MKKSTAFLTSFIFLLSGLIIGFLFSPIKKGIGNHSGNTTNYYSSKEVID